MTAILEDGRLIGNNSTKNKAFVTHISANCSHKSVCTFEIKIAEESFKVWLAYSAIKFVVKRHLKNQKKSRNKK